jgi:hypothetical protein
MLRRVGGVWRTRGLEILLRQICCSPSRWVSEGLPRTCCMLYAAKYGRGDHRDKGPLSVDWWIASFVPFLAAALSEPSQPRVPGTLGARLHGNRIHIGNFPVLRDSRKAERTQAQRTALHLCTFAPQTAPRAAPPTPPSVLAFCTILPILRPQPIQPTLPRPSRQRPPLAALHRHRRDQFPCSVCQGS